MLAYKPEPIPVEPKIYTVTLHAQQQSQVLIWHCAIAAFDPEGAKSRAATDLKEKNPELYQNGMGLGGWHVQSMIELTTAKIDQLLVEAEGKKSEIQQQQERQEVNSLMQTIVDTASRKLLNKHRDRFTTAEVGYMEDEIVKYEQGE